MIIQSEKAMKELGRRLGREMRGGECLELLGDVGAGKTTLVKGIAEGLSVDDDVSSPSFTLSRVYDARDGLTFIHYDFYRLHEAGVIAYELAESLANPRAIVAVEWGETIGAVLPDERIVVRIAYQSVATDRHVEIAMTGYDYLEGVV